MSTVGNVISDVLSWVDFRQATVGHCKAQS